MPYVLYHTELLMNP